MTQLHRPFFRSKPILVGSTLGLMSFDARNVFGLALQPSQPFLFHGVEGNGFNLGLELRDLFADRHVDAPNIFREKRFGGLAVCS